MSSHLSPTVPSLSPQRPTWVVVTFCSCLGTAERQNCFRDFMPVAMYLVAPEIQGKGDFLRDFFEGNGVPMNRSFDDGTEPLHETRP